MKREDINSLGVKIVGENLVKIKNKFVKHDFTLLFSFLCTLFIINIFLDSNFQIDAIAN